eukprot:scaffold132271_cov46-Tisochrysis_lutea.AAC.1
MGLGGFAEEEGGEGEGRGKSKGSTPGSAGSSATASFCLVFFFFRTRSQCLNLGSRVHHLEVEHSNLEVVVDDGGVDSTLRHSIYRHRLQAD